MEKVTMRVEDGNIKLVDSFESFLDITPVDIIKWGERNDASICVARYKEVDVILDDDDFVAFRKAIGAEIVDIDNRNYYYKFKGKTYAVPCCEFEEEPGDIYLDFCNTFEVKK